MRGMNHAPAETLERLEVGHVESFDHLGLRLGRQGFCNAFLMNSVIPVSVPSCRNL